MTKEEAKKVFENGLESIAKTNRPIEYRGKQKNTKEWCYGYYSPMFFEKDFEIVPCIISLSGEALDFQPVIPETVGQFTGLTDKNDEKIFEGDILQFEYTGKNLGVTGVAAVVFESGKFGVKWGNYKEFVCLDGFANTTFEVIGNIHDNKLEDFESGR